MYTEIYEARQSLSKATKVLNYDAHVDFLLNETNELRRILCSDDRKKELERLKKLEKAIIDVGYTRGPTGE